jgi:hypothetical protein
MTLADERRDHDPARSRWAARAVVLLVVAFLATIMGVGSLSGVCGSCHAMKPFTAALASSPHASVPCYSCHLPSGAWSWPGFKAREVLEMYPAAAAGTTVTAPPDRTPGAACLTCHAKILDAPVALHGLKIAHAFCSAGAACDSCHTDVAHGKATRWARMPDMDACLACHLRSSATIACDACHARRMQASRLAGAAWRATHGPTWATTHGRGEITVCGACHATGFCVSCHGIALPHPADFNDAHGGYSQVGSARCGECHDRVTFCDACHGVRVPHPDGYLQSHSTTTSGLKDPRCTRCHLASDCTACHRLHTHATSTRGTIGAFRLPALKP